MEQIKFLDKAGASQELTNRIFSTNSKNIDYLFGEKANIKKHKNNKLKTKSIDSPPLKQRPFLVH